MQGCNKLSGVPETFMQGCDKLSGVPETFMQECSKLSGVPESIKQGYFKVSEIVHPAPLFRSRGLQSVVADDKTFSVQTHLST
jgi:hypothetical protein